MRPFPSIRANRVRFACLLVPLCALFGLLVLVLLIGYLLPVSYQGSHSALLPHPPEVVWRAVDDFARYPVAGASALSVERLASEPDAPAWREDLGQVSLHVRTTRRVEPTHLEREVRGRNTPLEARFRLESLAVPEGTKLTATLEVDVRGANLGVPFARLVFTFGGARKWAQDYVEFLEQGLSLPSER